MPHDPLDPQATAEQMIGGMEAIATDPEAIKKLARNLELILDAQQDPDPGPDWTVVTRQIVHEELQVLHDEIQALRRYTEQVTNGLVQFRIEVLKALGINE